MRSSPWTGAVLLALVIAGGGCASIPGSRDPEPAALEALPLSASIAPVTIEPSGGEAEKRYDLVTVLDPAATTAEMARWLGPGVFGRTHVSTGADAVDAFEESWSRGDDLLVEIAVRGVETRFDGHNGLWIPNVVLWWLVMVPAWFVATEEYSLAFTVEAAVRSVDTGEVLWSAQREGSVAGTFGEFDRGWQFFGFLYPRNDPEHWRAVAEELSAAARSEAAALVADELETSFRRMAVAPSMRERTRKTLGLVVGVSRYGDPLTLPPLPFASSDAAAVVEGLVERFGVDPRRHLTSLADHEATGPALRAALEALRKKAHPGDRVVVTFAGYGTRDAGGEPVLLLAEADASGGGRVSIAELAGALGAIEGDVLVVLDTSFDGRGRSVVGGGAAPADPGRDLAPFERAGVAAILATRAGDPLVTLPSVEASLFGFHLGRALRDGVGRESAGLLSSEALGGFLVEHVTADAAYAGKRQRPLAVGLARGPRLRATALEEELE